MKKYILPIVALLLLGGCAASTTETKLRKTSLSQYEMLMNSDSLMKVNPRNYTRSRIAYHYQLIADAINSALHEHEGKIITPTTHMFFRKDNILELRLLDTNIHTHSFIMQYGDETILSDGGAGLKEEQMTDVMNRLRRALYDIQSNDYVIRRL